MKPILFNTEMVKAIMDGRKTVTRRLAKPQLPENTIEIGEVDPLGYLFFRTSDKYLDGNRNAKSPYAVGDILYVRETWTQDLMTRYDELAKDDYVVSYDQLLYKADGNIGGYSNYDTLKWHPSIHMPKEAARIFLRVKDVRVEKLRDISVADMISEGINTDGIITTSGPIEYRVINRFEELWNSTIKRTDLDKYSFDANPWVWVIEFERISKEVAYAERN